MITHLLYLHGFRSSPASVKAQMVEQALRQRAAQGASVYWLCPQLPPSPLAALELITQVTVAWPSSMAVMGSSLGGFYASVFAERKACPAVVINPVVHAARDYARFLEEHRGSPEEAAYFDAGYIEEFRQLEPAKLLHPEQYFALIAQGDEVLDWRDMVAHYAGAQMKVLAASDHAVSDFPSYLDEVLRFFGL